MGTDPETYYEPYKPIQANTSQCFDIFFLMSYLMMSYLDVLSNILTTIAWSSS